MKPAYLLVNFAAFISSSVSAAPKQVLEPAKLPDWSTVRAKVERLAREALLDPQAAQITWTQGFSWDSTKPIQLGGRRWGWVGCFTMNAKNAYGGYIGNVLYTVRFDADDKAYIAPSEQLSSKCDRSARTPLQPELVQNTPVTDEDAADKLAKLATLLDRGLITRNEFDQQKAKLLAR